jgi:hypothetical protein
LFALAAGHALRPAFVWGAACALGAAGAVVAFGKGRPLIGAPRWVTGAVCAVPALLVAALFLLSLTPAVGWDDSAYHLTVPRLWLEHGGFRRIPFNVPSNWPLSIELLYALAMTLQDYVLAKLVHLLFLAGTAVLLYRFTRDRTGSAAMGGVAVSLVLANPVLLFEAVQANVDIALAFFFLFGFVAIERRHELPSGAALTVAGLCCGLAAASKLSGLFVLAALVPVAWMNRGAGWTSRAGNIHRVKDALALCALTVLVALPWYVKCYLHTGDPWYPVLYPWLGGVEWSGQVHAEFSSWNRRVGMGRTPLDYVLLPARVVWLSGWGYDRFHGPVSRTWAIWLPLAIASLPRSPLIARALAASLVYFAAWAATRQETRYLIPVMPLLAVAATQALWLLVVRTPPEQDDAARQRRRKTLTIAVLVCVQALVLWSARGTFRRAASATRSVLVEGRVGEVSAMNDTERFIAKELPPSARLLMLNSNQGFFVRRDYVSDSFFEASQLNDLFSSDPSEEGIGRTLANLRATHVLWFNRDWGIPYPPSLLRLLDDPTYATPVYRSDDGRYRLYELR